MISKTVIPQSAIPIDINNKQTISTLAGKMSVNHVVTLRDICLPEFDKNRKLDTLKALVYDQHCQYDMILGSDFLTKTKMKLDYKHKVVFWFGNTIPLCNSCAFTNDDFEDLAECFLVQIDDKMIGDNWMESYVTRILDAKYETLSINAFIKTQTHLNEEKGRFKSLISQA